MKVAHQLGVGGFVETVRGRGGGLRLAKPVEEIGLAEVVRYTEPDMAIVQCFKPVDAPCAIRPSCVLRRALEKARAAFMAVLEITRYPIWYSHGCGSPVYSAWRRTNLPRASRGDVNSSARSHVTIPFSVIR
jgi:hypothetical protein